jgi:signal transduction histidine kinase
MTCSRACSTGSSATTKRAHAIEGCGLEPTIAQWIAQTHGGTIQLTSDPGKTTTVIVRLPLSDS